MRRLVAAMLVAVGAATVAADDLEMPPGRWWDNERLVERIDLTGEQRERIRDLVYRHARRMIDLTAAVKGAELELANVVEPPAFEADAARRAFARLQEARRELEHERFEMLLALRGELSADQWVEVQQLRRELRRHRDRPPGDGPPGARPPRGGPVF